MLKECVFLQVEYCPRVYLLFWMLLLYNTLNILMEAQGSTKLEWKVNAILGGNLQAKTCLPQNKALKRFLGILDKVDDSVFEQYLEYKKNKANKVQSKPEGFVEDLVSIKQKVINDTKAKIQELKHTVAAITNTIVESTEKVVGNLVQNIKDKILELGNFVDELELQLRPKNKTRIFQNWGETFNTQYRNIIYPTELDPQVDNQVQSIKNFVVNNSGSGLRTRGSGIRHSWGSVFSDPRNYLVSFYPYEVATGTSFELEEYATKMLKLQQKLGPNGIEHLGMIRKVGEYTANESGKEVKKHLVKIGAGVSNDQMRRWCIKNNLQYKSNVIMVEVNVCGGIGTCSHGAGIGTQTLCDYIYEVQFMDYQGNIQTINKNDNPQLILSAASSLGLLGLMIYVTLEMQVLDIVQFQPRQSYKDFVIPTPKNYAKTEQRKLRHEYQEWLKDHDSVPLEEDWDENFKKFKEAIHKTYCEWFYFPLEGVDVFENVWDVFAQKNEQNIARIRDVNPKGRFIDTYPPLFIGLLSQFFLWIGGKLVNNSLTQGTIGAFMKFPFAFFPNDNVYVNYPDAVHFQRGIQNMKVRDFEVQINVPTITVGDNHQIDYDLIQRLWWDALQIVQENKDTVNIALEMRMFKGSNATLAPEIGYEYVCSIEILRSLALNEEQQNKWTEIVLKVFNIWKNTLDSTGKPVIIRPHWGKEWDMYPEVKQHTFTDQALLNHVKKFGEDYTAITQLKGIDKAKNLKAFSNQLYRELYKLGTGETIE